MNNLVRFIIINNIFYSFNYSFIYVNIILARGCPAAVLRMWFSLIAPPIELCGGKPPEIPWTYMSDDHNMRLRYLKKKKEKIN